MDIEQIKKINEMTKTLQKHGIAQTSEDGSKIASKMEGAQLLNSESSDKIEVLLERQTRKFTYVLDEMSKRITELEKKLSNQISIREISSQHSEKTSKIKKKETQGQLRADPDQLNPEDFAVDKIFYYGNK